jgi:NTE family protein
MIYDSNPFNKKGQLSKFKAVMNLIKGKSSFSNTLKLLDLIRENYTIQDHYNLRNEIVVVVSNMTKKQPEYKSSKCSTWEEFTYWTWISTLAYPYSETVVVDGCEYADGGFTVNFPIDFAANNSDYVDAIIHAPVVDSEIFENRNVLQGIPSIIEMLMKANINKDIIAGHNHSQHGKKINYTFTPYELTESSMFFDPNEMKSWFDLGFNL